MAKNWRKKLKEKVESSPDYTGYRATTNDAATKSTASTSNSADWRQKIKDAVNDGSAAKKYQERYSNGSADALMANNPAYVYTKAYGDGKTGAAANRPVKGTATPRSRFEPAETGRPLGRASAQRAFTSTPTGNFKGEAILKSALSSSGAAYKKLGADVTSSTGNLSMGESARAAINEAKTAKKEGRQVRPGQAQRKAEQEKIKSFNDGWAGDFKQKLLESAEESSKRAYEYEQEAKQGLGKFGQGVVDFGIAGAQFAGDALLNAVAPGTGIAAMAGRAYGSASLDAQQRGLSEGEQQIFGLKSAAIEVLTEKLFGAASKVAYGKGIIKNESLVNGLVNRLAKTDKGRTALKVIVGANEEGLEEVLSDILNPIADRVLKLDDGKGDWSDLGEDMDAEQMLEDYIIGSTLGLFGAGTNVISGQYRAENAQQRAYENYQRELVNAGLASEQGSQAQLTAAEYQNILDNSAKRGNRNLSDKETANLEQLITAERDTPAVRNALERSGTLVDDNTASVIAKAASGQKLTRAEQSIIDNSPIMQQAVNTMSGSGAVANIRTTAAKNSVVNSMAERYTVSPEVINRTYDLAPVTSPEAFEMAFDAVYQMGQQGANKESLTKVPVLNRAQAEIAYNMGASTTQEAVDNAVVQGDNVSTQGNNQVSNAVNNTIQEVNNNGVRLRDSSQRLNGQNTEGQIPAVGRGTVEAYTGTDSGRQSGYSAAQGKAGQKVVYNGVEQENVYYSGEDTESMKKGRELARSYGYNVQYFEGGNIKDSGGEFRGMVDTESKTVMVRSDHPDISAEQIMRHEMGHAAIAQGDISLDELRSAMLSDLSEKELSSAAEVYRHAYGDTISEAEAFEEMCCDALGKINIFAGTEHDSASYGKVQESFRKHTAETANKGRAPPKGGVNGKKHSSEPLKYDYSKPFAEQVDDWIAGKIPKYDTLVIGATPTAFRKVGFNSLPMTINQSHVDYAINGTKNSEHHIGEALLKQLPSALEQPVAIIASETQKGTSVIALLPFTKDGKTVVAPVYIDGFGIQNTVKIDSNAVTSIYGRKNAVSNLLTKALNDHKSTEPHVFYLDKAKATALYQGSKVTVPKMPNTSDGFVSSIRDVNSPVKLKIKDVTESRQFKRWFGNSKVVNADGSPKIVYHQTENDFTVFDTRREGAGTRDNGTPFGIFLKSSNRDIGLKGKKQMALYARIVNPLRARDRSELTRLMRNMSPEYDALITQHETLDREYKSKTQQAIKELKDFMINWRANNPGADSRSLYDVSEFNALFDAEDALANEWTAKADELSTKAKNVMTNALESNGYDGVILENDAGSFGRSTDAYIALHPEQIKSATDNIGTFDESNPDIRYSREPESITELRRQNRELKKRVDYWKGQTQRTKVKIVRQSDVNLLAREVIDMSESDLKPQDITERLSKLGEHILNEKELRYTDIAEMAQDIAEDVVSNATTIVNEDDVQTHNRLRGYLKRVKLKDDGSAEFESIRNSYKRRIMFNKNGMSVDSAYAELNSMFGEGYFPEDIINPADQLERIAEVLDGTAPQYANPNGYYAEEAAEYMRNYIIDSMLSDQVRQTAPTMADKAAAREAKLKADNAERIKNAVKKERERNEVKLQRFKEGVARLDSKRKETALKNRYRGQIEKNVNTLSKWLLNPDHKNTLKHIPGQLQSTVRDFISAIDFTSSQQLGGGAPTIKDMKYIDSLDRLRRYIADSKVGEDRYSDLDLPPEFETQLADFVSSVNTLARNNKGTYTINDMTSEQLKELSDIVKTMKKAITDMNRLYQNATFQHVYEAGESDIETLREYTKTKAFTSKLAANRLDQAIMWESSRPAHVFKRFGKGGESMYQEFVDGQNTMAFLTKEVIDFAEDTYTTAEVKQWAKETHEFKFGDQRVKLTSAQLMSLYELNKRSQAKQHLDSGGFRVANFKDGKFNLQTDKEKHVFTDAELNEMFGELTGRQKEVADKLQHFMVERGGEWGNYVSRKRFDVEMFKDENYFPIKIDTTETDSKVDEKTDNASLYQLLNMGFTKETSAKANQSIVVYDIFDVFANHMSEMAQYRSFALPLLDMTKWFNIKVRDESGNVTASLRTEMRRAFGSDKNGRGFAEQFVTGIIKAYNGAEGRGDSSVNSRMINRVNRAAVAYNTRVMIQQPSAIVRAALYLDPKDLISSLKNYAGISTKQNIEEMHKHSGIALWKDLGFYDVNVSRGVQELIKHSQGTISKINEIGMKGAEFADKVTWAALWDASKKQVRRETGLSESDKEFFPKVSKVFENVIYNTQVVDTVLTKSEVSRNRSSGARLFTSFMSEPMTTASLVTSEIFDIQMKQAKGIKLKPSDYSRLSKTCIVVAVAAVVNSALASLADAWRDDDEYGTYGQKWTRAMRIKLADELNPLTYLPYASNVWDVTKAFLDWTDTKWFGVEVYGNGTDIPFADILESTEKAVKIFGEIREKGEDSKYTKFGGYYKVVNVLSKITGIPLYNIAREGVSLYNIFASDKIRSYEPSKEGAVKYAWNDGYLTDEEAIAALQDDAGMDEGEAWLEVEKWKNETTSNYTKLYDAIDNGGDIKKAVDELTEHGVEEKNIKSSLTRRYKDAYINGDNKEREKIRRALYATGVYGSVNEVIEKCNSWLKK